MIPWRLADARRCGYLLSHEPAYDPAAILWQAIAEISGVPSVFVAPTSAGVRLTMTGAHADTVIGEARVIMAAAVRDRRGQWLPPDLDTGALAIGFLTPAEADATARRLARLAGDPFPLTSYDALLHAMSDRNRQGDTSS